MLSRRTKPPNLGHDAQLNLHMGYSRLEPVALLFVLGFRN